MLIVKRLPWILVGLAIGVGVTVGPRVLAQDRIASNDVPPITLKFIGVLEHNGSKWAIFSNGNGQPMYASEGQVVQGQYKLLKISIESVTMSYLDGKGVQTIPMARKQYEVPPRIVAQERAVEDQVLTDHPAGGFTPWKFVSDSKTHSCWLAATTLNGKEVTALAPAPPEACR